MLMEDFRTDAEVARDRSLEAILTTDDVELQRALWKAALKYQTRVKAERSAGLEISRPPPRALWGLGKAERANEF